MQVLAWSRKGLRHAILYCPLDRMGTRCAPAGRMETTTWLPRAYGLVVFAALALAAACGSSEGDGDSSDGSDDDDGGGGAATSASSVVSSSSATASSASSTSSSASSSGTGGTRDCADTFGDPCGNCLEEACCDVLTDCLADPECNDCATIAYEPSCDDNFYYQATTDCTYSNACKADCYPTCDVFVSEPCGDCFEQSCCAELLACVQDQECSQCLYDPNATGCESIPLYLTFVECVVPTCDVACGASCAGQACDSGCCDTQPYCTGSSSLSCSASCGSVGALCESTADCCSSTCVSGTCQNVCVPSCAGKQCGPDGCGGSCGDCGGNSCIGGQCCIPSCAGKQCGSDGCGGTCGTCSGGSVCQGTQCCMPNCSGKECGSNGCGGTCGSCSGGETCQSGQCVPCTNAFAPGLCGDCLEQECCPQVTACVAASGCIDCVTGNGPAGCENGFAASNLLSCAASSCSVECQ